MLAKKLVLAWLPATVWMGSIFYLSSQSRPLESSPAYFTVLGHLLEYAVLAFLLFWALLVSGLSKGRGRVLAALAVSLVLAVLYAASDEYHQGYVPGRDASFVDWGVDLAGAAATIAVIWLWGAGPLGRRSRYRRTILPVRRTREAP